MVMIAQQCECAWGHRAIYLETVRTVDLVLCIFCHNRKNEIKLKIKNTSSVYKKTMFAKRNIGMPGFIFILSVTNSTFLSNF